MVLYSTAVSSINTHSNMFVRDLSLGSPKAEPGSNPRVLGPEHGAATRSRRVNGYPARKPVLRGLRKMELIKVPVPLFGNNSTGTLITIIRGHVVITCLIQDYSSWQSSLIRANAESARISPRR